MFLDKFWLRRDPDPATPANEYEDEFWRRVDYVDAHFATPLTEGVKSDRGEIYVRYGAPEEIEDYSGGAGSITGVNQSTWSSVPYYAWKYYGGSDVGGKRMIFVFADQVGDGEFTIFASTEPGFGKRIASFAEFDLNRLVVDEADTGAASETFWDPMRYGEKR
jgi:GWxTD domain-containing protein